MMEMLVPLAIIPIHTFDSRITFLGTWQVSAETEKYVLVVMETRKQKAIQARPESATEMDQARGIRMVDRTQKLNTVEGKT